MKITKTTKTRDVLPLLTDERLSEILNKIPRHPLDVAVVKMTVGQFLEATEKDYALKFFEEKRAVVAFGKLAQFRDEMDAVVNYIESYRVPTSDKVRKASDGIPFPSWQERVLCDLVAYYHLHSTAEAEALPVTDWLLLMKDTATSAMVRYNLDEMEKQKTKGASR